MKPSFEHWLALESLDDPLRHTQARLLQRFALVMLAAALLSLPVSLVAQSAAERLVGVITALALMVLLGSAILFLRRGRLHLAGLLIIVSTAASAALNMSTTGIEGSRAIFVLLIIPIVLGGLLGDRRLLLVGIRPEVAQTIVGLGLDLRSVRTYSDIETALSTNVARS
jgi:rsbT co-antagonist protein RsbR